MNTSPAVPFFVGLGLYLSGALPAQRAGPPPTGSPVASASSLQTGASLAAQSIASQFVALHRVDGELWGGGPDYKVLFEEDGIELNRCAVGVTDIRVD